MKTEKPTKTRKVQLIPIMANVQKLISPSPENKTQLLAEVAGANLLQKQLVLSSYSYSSFSKARHIYPASPGK